MNREDVIREIQERYRQVDRSLNECQRRHWAAREALQLGRGGITIVSQALRISPNTIKRGMQEIATGQADANSPANARIRKPGGGRKPKKTSSAESADKQSAQEILHADRFRQNRPDPAPIPVDRHSIPAHDCPPDQNSRASET